MLRWSDLWRCSAPACDSARPDLRPTHRQPVRHQGGVVVGTARLGFWAVFATGQWKCWPFMGTGELGREWVESTRGCQGPVQPLST